MALKEAILIVEDQSGPQTALEMILKPLYDTKTASNGKDALNLFREHNFDLVTLDLKMPGLSGIEVLQEIKKIRPDVEVVVISSEASPYNTNMAFQYGASGFIIKPFDVAEILAVIRKSLERRKGNCKIHKIIQEMKDS